MIWISRPRQTWHPIKDQKHGPAIVRVQREVTGPCTGRLLGGAARLKPAQQNRKVLDRLEIQEVGSDCSDDRVWPNPCLREVGYEILKDQLVTAERARQGRPG